MKNWPIFVAALLFLFALAWAMWWSLADREPTSKELTFSYRRFAMNESAAPLAASETIRLSNKLHKVDLLKKNCTRLGNKRYRCEVDMQVTSTSSDIMPGALEVYCAHDDYGWTVEKANRQ